jgi:hypothetical protein
MMMLFTLLCQFAFANSSVSSSAKTGLVFMDFFFLAAIILITIHDSHKQMLKRMKAVAPKVTENPTVMQLDALNPTDEMEQQMKNFISANTRISSSEQKLLENFVAYTRKGKPASPESLDGLQQT